jgi:hypothetical protein
MISITHDNLEKSIREFVHKSLTSVAVVDDTMNSLRIFAIEMAMKSPKVMKMFEIYHNGEVYELPDLECALQALTAAGNKLSFDFLGTTFKFNRSDIECFYQIIKNYSVQ